MKILLTPLAAVPALFVSLALSATPVQADNDTRDSRDTRKTTTTEKVRTTDKVRAGDTTRMADTLRNKRVDDKTTVPANRMPRDSTADTSLIPVRPGF